MKCTVQWFFSQKVLQNVEQQSTFVGKGAPEGMFAFTP